MRVATWVSTALFVALLGIGATFWAADEVVAQLPAPQGAALTQAATDGSLIALSSNLEGGVQQVTVIDSKTRSMAVYHVDPVSGSIALKCVRNIQADLEIDDLNGESPSPAEIRSLLQPR